MLFSFVDSLDITIFVSNSLLRVIREYGIIRNVESTKKMNFVKNNNWWWRLALGAR